MRRPGFGAPLIASLVLAWPASALASAGWGQTFRLASEQPSDVLPARAAISGAGELAVGFSRYDEDQPSDGRAYAVVRSPQGRLSGPRRVPGSQEVLDFAYQAGGLYLLAGGSESGQTCCSYTRLMALAGGRFRAPRTVVGRLAGAALGRLVAVGAGKLLAVVATGQGVWDAQSTSGASLGPTRRLSVRGQSPWTVATALQGTADSFVGWTEASPQAGDPGPRTIMVAQGSEQAAPRGRRAAVSVPAGHGLDELTLAPGRGAPLAAWIESWFTSDGSYRSQAVLGDLRSPIQPRALPVPASVASGLTAAGDGTGENVVAWKACDTRAECAVWATFRDSGRHFGPTVRLGAIDASQAPASTVAGGGRALVGWIDSGRVLSVERRPGEGRFSRPIRLASSFAHDLTLTSAPGGPAAAVWTEGTVSPSVLGALYTP